MPKLTKRIVDAAEARDQPYFLWCSDLPGFGVRVFPSGKRVYYADYRPKGGGSRKRMSLGQHGKLTTEEARRQAVITLGSVLQGEDPAEDRATRRKSITVKELCERYLNAADKGHVLGKGDRPKKASTIDSDRSRIRAQVVPLLGTKRVMDLTRTDITRFMRDIAEGKAAKVEKTEKKRGKSIVRGGTGAARRTVGMLGGVLAFAVAEGIIATNPVHGVKRTADGKRRARLVPETYRRLGKTLALYAEARTMERAVEAVWLLLLTGCRSSEITALRWSEVDLPGQALRLHDSKEGASVRPLGKAAVEVLQAIERKDSATYVLPGRGEGTHYGGLPGAWRRIAKHAGLTGITPHTLRHSFASTAGDLGMSKPTVEALLGHAGSSVTDDYMHILDAVLVAAADKVTEAIRGYMTTDAPGGADAST